MSLPLSAVLKTTTGQILPAMANVLRKTQAHAAERNIAEEAFLSARLYPDMFALTRQVQIACDMPARGAARLAGAELPSFPDTETSFADLIGRIEKALAFIDSMDAAAIDAADDKTFEIPMGPGKVMAMTGRGYLMTFVLPNMYFHAATTYGLLRHNGVGLGKADFMTP